MATEKKYNLIVNCETGVQETVEFTAEQYAQAEIDAAAHAEAEAIRKAETDALEALKASARAKLVSGTPLTEEEAATLVL